MSENLRDEITTHLLSKAERSYRWSHWAVADEIADLVGPELDRLREGRDECERQYQVTVTAVIAEMNRADAAQAEVDRLRAEVERWRGLYSVQHDRADRAEVERDDLRARLAKVEALADGWEHWDGYARRNFGERTHGPEYARALRAALASVPEPSDSDEVHPATERVSPAAWAAVNQIADAHINVPDFPVELEDEPSDSEPAPDADLFNPACACTHVDGTRHLSPWCEVHAKKPTPDADREAGAICTYCQRAGCHIIGEDCGAVSCACPCGGVS